MSGRVAKKIRKEALKSGIDPASALFRQHYRLLKKKYNDPQRSEGRIH